MEKKERRRKIKVSSTKLHYRLEKILSQLTYIRIKLSIKHCIWIERVMEIFLILEWNFKILWHFQFAISLTDLFNKKESRKKGEIRMKINSERITDKEKRRKFFVHKIIFTRKSNYTLYMKNIDAFDPNAIQS